MGHTKWRKRVTYWSLLLLLMPFVFTLSSVATNLIQPYATVAYAKEKKPVGSDDSSDNSSEAAASSSSSSNAEKSTWNTALSTLSQTAISASSDNSSSPTKTTGNPEDQQADLKTLLNGGNDPSKYLLAWGFMGPSNSDVWEKNNASSYTASYTSLIAGNTSNDKLNDAYKQAGRFAYIMQATGLDQPVKSGFNGNGILAKGGALGMQLAYFILAFAQKLFTLALSVLAAINPINWALYGLDSPGLPTGLKPLAEFVNKLYNQLTTFGGYFILFCLTGALILAGMGISVGGNGFNQGKALLNTFLNMMKRILVWTFLPILGLSLLSTTVNLAQTAFQTQNNSVPNYAIYGAFVDYNSWALNSRLALPSDVRLPATYRSDNIPVLKHSQIMSINYKGIGNKDLAGLYNSITSSNTPNEDALNTANKGFNTKLDDDGLSLLQSWFSGNTITAADYASSQDGGVRKQAIESANASSGSSSSDSSSSQPDLSTELVKLRYNDNGTNAATSYSNNGYFTNNANQQNVTNGQSPDGSRSGGLSTLGMYAYMLTTAQSNNMTIGNTDQLSNDVAQPAHKSTVLVGSGITGTGNVVWAMGLLMGLAIIVAGYLIEVFLTIWNGLTGVTFATLKTALSSISGGIQFVSVLVGLLVGLLGSAIMYQFAQIAFISVAQFFDTTLSNQFSSTGAINFLSIIHYQAPTEAGSLAIDASGTTILAIANMFYGAALIFLAIILLKYRSLLVASISQIVEETVNKIMASLASATGTSSSGTRGTISKMAGSSGSVGANLMTSLGKGAMLATVGAAGLTGAGAMMGVGPNASAKSVDKAESKEREKGGQDSKSNNTNSRTAKESSSDKQGTASQRMQNAMQNRDGTGSVNGNPNDSKANGGTVNNTQQINGQNNNQLGNQNQNGQTDQRQNSGDQSQNSSQAQQNGNQSQLGNNTNQLGTGNQTNGGTSNQNSQGIQRDENGLPVQPDVNGQGQGNTQAGQPQQTAYNANSQPETIGTSNIDQNGVNANNNQNQMGNQNQGNTIGQNTDQQSLQNNGTNDSTTNGQSNQSSTQDGANVSSNGGIGMTGQNGDTGQQSSQLNDTNMNNLNGTNGGQATAQGGQGIGLNGNGGQGMNGDNGNSIGGANTTINGQNTLGQSSDQLQGQDINNGQNGANGQGANASVNGGDGTANGSTSTNTNGQTNNNGQQLMNGTDPQQALGGQNGANANTLDGQSQNGINPGQNANGDTLTQGASGQEIQGAGVNAGTNGMNGQGTTGQNGSGQSIGGTNMNTLGQGAGTQGINQGVGANVGANGVNGQGATGQNVNGQSIGGINTNTLGQGAGTQGIDQGAGANLGINGTNGQSTTGQNGTAGLGGTAQNGVNASTLGGNKQNTLGDSGMNANNLSGNSNNGTTLGANGGAQNGANSTGTNGGSMLGAGNHSQTLGGGNLNTLGAGGNNAVSGSGSNGMNGTAGNGTGTDGSQLHAGVQGSSLGNNNTLGTGSGNGNGITAVNPNATGAGVQSQMGSIQGARDAANNANSLANANPGNQALQAQAQAANGTLSNLQNNAMGAYNQQPVGAGTMQSQWLASGTDGSKISMGTANNAMNSIYGAQQGLAGAQNRFGEGSKQVGAAQQKLNQARQNGINLGLSPNAVNDPSTVDNAHQAIEDNAAALMNGSWKPTNTAAGSQDGSRSIGI